MNNNQRGPALPAALIAGEVPAELSHRPLSVTDMFRIGIGPSSSHTVGPMRAGCHFAQILAEDWIQVGKPRLLEVRIELCGSLGATGKGHSTDRAVLLGLEGWIPDQVPTAVVEEVFNRCATQLQIANCTKVDFEFSRDVIFSPATILPYHVNGLIIEVRGENGYAFASTYYSVGGGFVMREIGKLPDGSVEVEPITSPTAQLTHEVPAPYPFATASEILTICKQENLSIAQVVRANEEAVRSRVEVDAYIDSIRVAMNECIECGLATEGVLPGVLQVQRRAHGLYQHLQKHSRADDPLQGIDWVNLWALAVNEENAAGHRVVTAPTNGAAGIIPAVLRYHQTMDKFASDATCRDFILAATAVGALIKTNASIAGAEVGCQGEVGSATAMAAAGLAQALGGTPGQVENAAEIAMEHSLGLTCDPVAGLVQIPCIERNAIGAVKAINAARMALWGDGKHQVDLDTVIETMRQTGEDMNANYKETSAGGLAVNVVEC